jgi:hypothetical protein
MRSFHLRNLSAGLVSIWISTAPAGLLAAPAWWGQRGATSTSPPNDDAVVNQGQLKHFAQTAIAELNAIIPGGAGADLNALAADWAAGHPDPDDWHAVTSGQLKWIAKMFHDRLAFARYQENLPAWLPANPPAVPIAADRALINVGQLKMVFSFDFGAPAGQLPQWWQKYYFNGQLGISPMADYDGDGLTNVQEYQQNSSPIDNLDLDSDGMPDLWEEGKGLNPLADDSLEDNDGDRIPNIFEYRRWTDPEDAASFPGPTFQVDPATGGNSTTDNIFTTINEAVQKGLEAYWDQVTESVIYEDLYPIIQVKAGVYLEAVSLSGQPFLLLGELGSMQGPPVILADADDQSSTLSIYSASVVDGFVLSHKTRQKGSGLAVDHYSYENTSHRRRLVNCFIRGNTADHGGAIYLGSGELDIVHCTIIDNSATYQGRAIYNYQGKVRLINSIVWGNSGGASEDIYSDSIGLNPVVSVNSFIAGGAYGGYNEDPKTTANGWLTVSSPAIDRLGSTSANCSGMDANGETRPVGVVPDIGADEYKDSNGNADGDGLPDWIEGVPDDDDGLTLATEYLNGTSPLLWDTDFDGLADGEEMTPGIRSDPLDPDTDQDGMLDGWEVANNIHPLFNDSMADPDGDRYPNLYEFYQNKNPLNSGDKPVPDYIVDPSGATSPFTTISSATYDAYMMGGTRKIISVLPGAYTEASEGSTDYLYLYDEVLVVAPGGPLTTILDGSGTSSSFYLSGVLSGFGITNMPGRVASLSHERAGMLGCRIYSNTSTNSLVTLGSDGAQMADMLFTGNQAPSMVECGKGHILNCRFDANTGLTQGVISRQDSGTVEVYNSMFVNNIGTVNGLAGYFSTSSTALSGYAASFVNCTFAGNNVSAGGTAGIFYLSASTPPVNVRNSIVWNNNSRPIFKGTQANLLFSNSDVQGGYAGLMNWNLNPLLASDNKISATSPCLDLASSAVLVPFDIAYGARVLGNYADLGPHEVGDGDADNDGLPDTWEIQNFGNITVRNGTGDEDGDGLTNLDEYLLGKPPATYNGVQNIQVLETLINAAGASRNMRIRFTSYQNQTVTLKFYKFYYDFNTSTGDFGVSHFDLLATKSHSAVTGENIYTWDGIVTPPSGFHSGDVVAVEVISNQPSPGVATEVVGNPSTYVDAQQITSGVTGQWINPTGTGTTQYHNVPTPVIYGIASRRPSILNTKSHHTLLQNRPVTGDGVTCGDWLPIADNGSTYGTGAVYAPTTVTGRNLPLLSAIYENQYPEVTNFTVQSYRSIPSNGEVGHIRFNLSKATQLTLELADSSLVRYPIYIRQSNGTYVQALNLSLPAGNHDLEFKVLNYQVTPAQPTHFNYQKVVLANQAGFFRVRAGWVKDTRLQGAVSQAHRGFKWAHIHVE